MQNKKIGLLLTVLALAIFSVMTVSAAPAVTINSPVKYGNYSATMLVNVTNDLVNASEVSYNVTLYCNKSGGSVNARLAGDKVVTIWNNTAKDSEFATSVSVSSLTDALEAYNCSAYADNGTAAGTAPAWATTAARYVTIDNTAPVCDLRKVYGPQIPYMGLQEVIWSSSDAIELKSTATSYTNPSGTTAYTDADRDLILQGSDLTSDGDYSFSLVATDRAGNTCTKNGVSWSVYTPGAASSGAASSSASAGSFSLFGPSGIDLSGLNWGTIALVILAIIVIVAIAKKK